MLKLSITLLLMVTLLLLPLTIFVYRSNRFSKETKHLFYALILLSPILYTIKRLVYVNIDVTDFIVYMAILYYGIYVVCYWFNYGVIWPSWLEAHAKSDYHALSKKYNLVECIFLMLSTYLFVTLKVRQIYHIDFIFIFFLSYGIWGLWKNKQLKP